MTATTRPPPGNPLFPAEPAVTVVYGRSEQAAQFTARLRAHFVRLGLSEAEAARHVLLVDGRGLVLHDRLGLEPHKRRVALTHFPLRGWPAGGLGPSLPRVIAVSGAACLIHVQDTGLPVPPAALAALGRNTPTPRVYALHPSLPPKGPLR